MLLLSLMSSLCRIEFRFYDYITMEHTLTFEITFTYSLRYFSACYKHCFHSYLHNVLRVKTDHDRLLTTLAKSIVSKETLCDFGQQFIFVVTDKLLD